MLFLKLKIYYRIYFFINKRYSLIRAMLFLKKCIVFWCIISYILWRKKKKQIKAHLFVSCFYATAYLLRWSFEWAISSYNSIGLPLFLVLGNLFFELKIFYTQAKTSCIFCWKRVIFNARVPFFFSFSHAFRFSGIFWRFDWLNQSFYWFEYPDWFTEKCCHHFEFWQNL